MPIRISYECPKCGSKKLNAFKHAKHQCYFERDRMMLAQDQSLLIVRNCDITVYLENVRAKASTRIASAAMVQVGLGHNINIRRIAD